MSYIVLGVDPGSRTTGYGLVTVGDESWQHLDSGFISLPAHLPQSERLSLIYRRLKELINHYQPAAVALEEVFVAHNVQSTLKLGQVRGVVLLAAGEARIPVYEYSPLVVKKAIVGYGQATKTQVLMLVEQLLGLRISNHNTADALALGLCHLFRYRWQDIWDEEAGR